jgi:hypothetical protein
MDQAHPALVMCSATANITIPIASDDQKSQLKRSACQMRPSAVPAVSSTAAAPSTTSAAIAIFTVPVSGARVRNGMALGIESCAMNLLDT